MRILNHRLCWLAAFFSGLAGSVVGATIAINPVADAFTTTGPGGSLSGNNYGGAGALAISGAASGKGAFASVIRFDLSIVKAGFDAAYGAGQWTVQSITLQLASTSPNNPAFNAQSSGQFSIIWMQDDGWEEGSGSPNAPGATGITYNTLPSFLGSSDQTVGIYSFNATSGGDGTLSIYSLALASGLLGDISGGSLASFELAAASENVSYLFNSRSFGTQSRRPLLTITAVAIPEPRTLFLLSLGCAALVWRQKRSASRRRDKNEC